MKQKVCPIDTCCKIKGMVLEDKSVHYSCTLNQTDIESNKNKFYIMQIINDSTNYHLYIRYGRVGENGKIIDNVYQNKNDAINAFVKQFKSKTSNVFGKTFTKKTGKYFMADVQYEIEQEEIKLSEPINKTQSKLCDRQTFLMELFTNKKTMENTLISLSIDPKKMPLGKISKLQLNEAQNVLNQIQKLFPVALIKSKVESVESNKQISTQTDQIIKDDDKDNLIKENTNSESKKRGRPKKIKTNIDIDIDTVDNNIVANVQTNATELINLSSQFYTLVPYSCGRNLPPIINNQEILSKYVEMLDDLKNLEVAIKVTKHSGDNLDNVYDSLDAKIKPLEKNSQIWNIIKDYITNTHGSTHKTKVELVDIYDLQRNKEPESIELTLKKIGNRQLLWHGSRMTNFCSIIKNGLILNPETLGVYISGKMFGAGIYLASSFSKSFGYCSSETSDGYACLLLCESALGKQLEKTKSDSYLSPDKLKKMGNFNSTWGMGQNTPSNFVTYENMIIPNGKLKKSNISTCLLYDEYIVYDTNQISLKYLVIVKSVK